MERLAVIDLGSNSIRMSIFEIERNKKFRQIGSYRSMIKLSEGMNEDMCLKPEAQLRAIKALLEYKHILDGKGVTKLRAVATAAVRKARNGAQFVASVKDVVGIDIEVIDGEYEAELDCLAVSGTVGCRDGIICDIGGGSTEVIAIKDGRMKKPVISIPMGSRSLTEMFFAKGETPEARALAEEFADGRLEEIPWLDHMLGMPIIGIGGTLRALAKYHMDDRGKDTIGCHSIEKDEIDRLFESIASTTPKERESMAGIGKERSDIILGGLIPFMRLKARINAPKLIVADVSLREGILYEILENRM